MQTRISLRSVLDTQNSSIRTVIRPRTGRPEFDSLYRQEFLHRQVHTGCRTNLVTQWAPGNLSVGVERPGGGGVVRLNTHIDDRLDISTIAS
jgi:hypothetical protein